MWWRWITCTNHLSIYLSIYLFIYLSMYVYVCVYIYILLFCTCLYPWYIIFGSWLLLGMFWGCSGASQSEEPHTSWRALPFEPWDQVVATAEATWLLMPRTKEIVQVWSSMYILSYLLHIYYVHVLYQHLCIHVFKYVCINIYSSFSHAYYPLLREVSSTTT